MKKTVKSLTILMLVLAIVFSCMTGCTKKEAPSTKPAPSTDGGKPAETPPESESNNGKKMKIALVLPGKKDDVSFNQAMYAGVMEYADKHTDQVEVKVVENIYETADIEPTLIEYAEEGYDVIIGHGYQFSEPVNTVAAQYPDTIFLLGCGVGYQENSAIYDVKLEAGGYLMGVVAALASQSGKIGVVGGGEASEIKRGHEGFKAAAKSINPNIEIQEVYTGDWTDTAGAYEAAVSMYDSGADIIWHSGDGIGLGVVQAAQEKDQYVLGNVEDQLSLAPKNVLSGLQYEWGSVLETIFADIASGALRTNKDDAKTYWIDMDNLGLSMTPINDTKSFLSADDTKVIEDTLAKLQAGEIELPEVHVG